MTKEKAIGASMLKAAKALHLSERVKGRNPTIMLGVKAEFLESAPAAQKLDNSPPPTQIAGN